MNDLMTTSRYGQNGTVCAVVVTYNIGRRVLDTLVQLTSIVDHCIIIDNGSTDNTVDAIREFITRYPQTFTLTENRQNNLASAQNMGICYALEHEFDWVLLLDHDSVPRESMVGRMLQAYYSHPYPKRIGMVVPNMTDRFSKRAARYVRYRTQWLFYRSGFRRRQVMDNILLAISSGSLIPASTFGDIGLMDEGLCIDKVDYDFSLRIIRRKKRILAVRDAMLHHQLGKCRDHHVLGACVTTSNHRPERRYSIYRNRLTLWKTHGRAVPAYIMFDCVAIAYDVLKIGLFEANKRNKFQAIRAGIKDAWQAMKAPALPMTAPIKVDTAGG